MSTSDGPLDPLGLKRPRQKYGWNNWRILISAITFSFFGVTALHVLLRFGTARPAVLAVLAGVALLGGLIMIVEFRRRHGIPPKRLPTRILERRVWLGSLAFGLVGLLAFGLFGLWLVTRAAPFLPVAIGGIILTLLLHGWVRKQRQRLRVHWAEEPVRFKATTFGSFHILLTAAIGLVAMQTGLNLLIGIFAVMLTMIVVSGMLVAANFAKLRIERELPEEIIAGESTLIRARLHNEKRWLPSFSLWLQEGWPHGVTEPELLPSAYAVRIPPSGGSELSYEIVFPERGVFRLMGFSVMSRFPFSMFARYRYLTDEQEVVVFPPLRQAPQGLVPAAARPSATSNASSAQFGLGDVRGIRSYVPGIDDVASIHWPSTARLREPTVRERERETAGALCITLERTTYGERLEQAIALCAALIEQAWRQRVAMTLVVPPANPVAPPAAGIATRRACLEALARLRGYAPRHGQASAPLRDLPETQQPLPVTAREQEEAALQAGAEQRWALPPGSNVLAVVTENRQAFHHFLRSVLGRGHHLVCLEALVVSDSELVADRRDSRSAGAHEPVV